MKPGGTAAPAAGRGTPQAGAGLQQRVGQWAGPGSGKPPLGHPTSTCSGPCSPPSRAYGAPRVSPGRVWSLVSKQPSSHHRTDSPSAPGKTEAPGHLQTSLSFDLTHVTSPLLFCVGKKWHMSRPPPPPAASVCPSLSLWELSHSLAPGQPSHGKGCSWGSHRPFPSLGLFTRDLMQRIWETDFKENKIRVWYPHLEHSPKEFFPIAFFTHIFAITSHVTPASVSQEIESRRAAGRGGFLEARPSGCLWKLGVRAATDLRSRGRDVEATVTAGLIPAALSGTTRVSLLRTPRHLRSLPCATLQCWGLERWGQLLSTWGLKARAPHKQGSDRQARQVGGDQRPCRGMEALPVGEGAVWLPCNALACACPTCRRLQSLRLRKAPTPQTRSSHTCRPAAWGHRGAAS